MASTTLWGCPTKLTLTLDSGYELVMDDFMDITEDGAVIDVGRVLDQLCEAEKRGL